MLRRIFISSVLGGIFISIGATSYLLSDNIIVGSFLFSIGLLSIMFVDGKLFTGMMSTKIHIKNFLQYLSCYIGNFVGILISTKLIKFTRIYPKLFEKSNVLIQTKMSDNVFSLLVLGILCGICISIAVQLKNKYEEKAMGIIIIPIMVFIICSFEHSIANFYYILISNNILSLQAWKLIIVVLIGNIIGGPIISLMKDKNNGP